MSGRVDSRKTHETARSRKPAAPKSRPKAQETPRGDSVHLSRRASGGGASPQVRAQRQAVGRALRTGETVRFPSRHGHQATVRLQGPERENGSSVYRGRVDGLPVELRLPAGRDGRAALTRAVDRQTATPAERRDMGTVAQALRSGEGGRVRGQDGKPVRIGQVQRFEDGYTVKVGGREVFVRGSSRQSLRELTRNVRDAAVEEKSRAGSVSEALRSGRPVPFRSSSGHDEELVLRRIQNRDGTRAYQAVLDGVSYELSTPVGGNRRDLMREIDEHTASARDRKRVDSVRQALESGQPLDLKPTVGDPLRVQLRQLPTENGRVRYTATVDGRDLQISMPEGNGRSLRALTRMLDFYAETPDHHRPALRELEIQTGPRADEQEVVTRLGTPTARIAADAGDGRIRFFRDGESLNRSVFNHEMGHVVGRTASFMEDPLGRGFVPMPRDWPGAIAGDRRSMSPYGDSSPIEDFAESWDAYVTARRRGDEALEAFQRRYPHRFAILDPLYREMPELALGPRPA